MTTSPITVYWRPGCVFCASLEQGLEREGLGFDRRNIWEDQEAAAFVRSVASGNETVPTVTVGETALVNPTARDVLATVASQAPDALPAGWEPPEPGRLARLFSRLLDG